MNSIGSSARVALEERQLGGGRRQHDLRLQRAADLLVLPQRLDLGQHPLAQRRSAVSQRSSRSRSTSALELGRASGTRAMCTDSSRAPGRYRHSSSAVNDRIGASSRVRPSAMRYIAVCADRRSRDRAANVYSRSFETSA